MSSRKWWRAAKGEVLSALRRTLNGASEWFNHNLSDRYVLTWFDERDRLVNRYGWGGALELGNGALKSRYSWLDGASVPSPNIVKSTTDTVQAWIINEQPPITVSASGAKFEDQYSIEEFEMALSSLFDTSENERVMARVGRDGVLSGFAFAWPRYAFGEIRIERLLPWQVQIDPFDSRDGNPRTVHVTEYRDREDVLAIADHWKGAKKGVKGKISQMDPVCDSIFKDRLHSVYDVEMAHGGVIQDADRLEVRHSWRVASYPGRNDGRYVMSVAGADDENRIVLIDQKFGRTTLPVCVFNPMPSDEGIYGTGFGHLMLAWQEAIDRIMFKIQKALDKYGHIRILIPSASEGTFKNMMDAMASYGVTYIPTPGITAPQVMDPKVVRSEDLDHLNRLLDLSQSIYGINSMMSRGASQLGANASGQALQEEHYRSLDRFTDLANNWHAFRIRVAEELLNLLDDVLKSDPKFSASYNYLGRSTRKSWKELSATKERCSISLEARGDAAVSRGGRTARVQEWAAQGLIDPSLAKEALLTTPDLVAAARIAMAPIRLVEWQIRKVIESEEWFDAKPDADTPLDIAIARSTAAIQRAIVEGAEPETIERLREYKFTAESLIPPPEPPPGMVPPGMPPEGIPPELLQGAPV